MAKILLADDSTHAQRMGTKILTSEGHEVSTVSNGQAAIQALQQAPPELVIADVFMPGKNGYEVCTFVKTQERLKNIPVLLIIGAMEPYDPEEGRRAGADGLVTKPLESSTLANTVKDLLAAAKRFAPARAAAKEPASVQESPKAAEAPPDWDEMPDELITPAGLPKMEIPEEISQQAVGMLTEYMEEPAPDPLGAAQETPSPAVEELYVPPPPPFEEEEEEITQVAGLSAHPRSLAQMDVEEQTVWSAVPAELTEEEARLFDQPAPDWKDLEELVEKTTATKTSTAIAEAPEPEPEPVSPPVPLAWPAPSPAKVEPIQMPAMDFGLVGTESAPVAPDPLLIRPDDTPAQVDSDPEIEHYENLDAVVEAQGPVKIKADPEPSPDFPGPVEELEAPPSERNMPPVEQLVRQAIEGLLPEIVERVKQSLKS